MLIFSLKAGSTKIHHIQTVLFVGRCKIAHLFPAIHS